MNSKDAEIYQEKESMSDWTLKIRKVVNGYVLDGVDAMLGTPMTKVIEDNEADILQSHEALLYEVMEYFNFAGSKHDEERIRVKREKKKGER